MSGKKKEQHKKGGEQGKSETLSKGSTGGLRRLKGTSKRGKGKREEKKKSDSLGTGGEGGGKNYYGYRHKREGELGEGKPYSKRHGKGGEGV